MTSIRSYQLRTAVFLVSLVIIALEITLMRELALRFWEHLAWLVISIALLGFGVSGTVLVLLQRFLQTDRSLLQYISLLLLALSLPFCLLTADKIDLDLMQMAWQPLLIWKLGALEIVFGAPFLFGAMFIGLALQDKPENVPGHYAASFIGSGAGGILILPALYFLLPRQLVLCCSFIIIGTALSFVRGWARTGAWLCSALILIITAWQQYPYQSLIAEDKDLPQVLAMPESEVVARRYGPQGLIHIVEAPAVHSGLGLSLTNARPILDQQLVMIDAQIAGSLFRNSSDNDFGFLDNTTQSLPYHLADFSNVLIANEGGTTQIGLALYHGADNITALTTNESLRELKSREISSYINHLYGRDEVSFMTATLRGFLQQSERSYSLIVLPTTGEDFGGLGAATVDSFLTLDTFRLCFDRLAKNGLLSITTRAHSPPRESLRLFNMFIDVLKENGREPQHHIVMIRNWATVTLVAAKQRISDEQAGAIRSFARNRGFDLVWLPDLKPAELNKHHILEEPQYYLGAKNLLDPENNRFISTYLYDLTSPDDNRPFFHHFSRLGSLNDLSVQLGKRSRAYIEIGVILLVAALVQAGIIAFVLIVLPLFPVIGLSGSRSERFYVITFFAAIGLGFMLLEMGMLQRLTVYLGHPVYAAAAVLSGFLFFGGLGSIVSSRLKDPLAGRHCGLGMAIAATGMLILPFLERFLPITERFDLPARIVVVMLLIGPVATLMGMMFPLGLKRIGKEQAPLIPWAWSVNGFTSVLAALCAPLIGMQWGFAVVAWSALGCYFLAAIFSLKLPR